MRVHLGSDHAGFALKAKIEERLRALGHEPVDHGPRIFVPDDDYPTYCLRVAMGAVSDPGSLGIVIGGSGNGEAIAANKVKGARCALAHSDETARLGRAHNDANVLSLGARMITEDDALRFVEIFVTTPFSGDARHARRIAQLADFETTGKLPDV
ncbi:MAG: Ribose 5-phosphate isomerase [Labilithrix sp.]|nr:Ribose 5-phosphate isomerase [Labilithrix sp.]